MPLTRDVNAVAMDVTAYTGHKQREREQQQQQQQQRYDAVSPPPLFSQRHDAQPRGRMQPRLVDVKSRTRSSPRLSSDAERGAVDPEHLKIFRDDLEKFKAVRRSESRKATANGQGREKSSEPMPRKEQDGEHRVGPSRMNLDKGLPVKPSHMDKDEGRKVMAPRNDQKETKREPVSTFDDTQSFSFDDTEHEDEQTQILRPHFTVPHSRYALPQTGNDQLAFDARTATFVKHYDIFGGLGDNWQAEVEQEKLYQQRRHLKAMQQANTDSVAEVEIVNSQDDDAQRYDQEINQATPSRQRIARSPSPAVSIDPPPQTVASARSPALQQAQLQRVASPSPANQLNLEDPTKISKLAFHSKPGPTTRKAVASTSLNQNLNAPVPNRFIKSVANTSHPLQMTTKVSSRESDVVEASEDDDSVVVQTIKSKTNTLESPAGPQQGKKRQRDAELDYPIDVLKKKSYADLQSEDFNTDPQDIQPAPVLDAGGKVVTLQQRLLSLSQMEVNDQRDFFRAQSDEEWSQIGEWFANKFREDLEKLAAIRLERRKISTKFECEIAKRQKEVEIAGNCVQKELEELKAGGEQLTKGRMITGSRAGTPMR